MLRFAAAKNPLFVGLDIGATKIAVVVGEARPGAEPRILSVGCAPHAGPVQAEVVDMGQTVHAVREAVEKAEHAAGVAIQSAFVSLAGTHVRTHVTRSAVAVSRADAEITRKDVERALDLSRQALRRGHGEIIHEIPLGFCVDGMTGIDDPVGLSGHLLEVRVFYATGSAQAIRTICRCAEKAGIAVAGIALDPLASACAVLSEDERDAGVLLIDIGGGATDIAMYYQGKLCHTGVVGMGGKNATRDMAIGMRLPPTQAEALKCAPGHPVPAQAILRARMEEIFLTVSRQIQPFRETPLLGAGIVLTGGGALLHGVTNWAENILAMPAICKHPAAADKLSPLPAATLSTSVGLVHYAIQSATPARKPSLCRRIMRALL